MFNCEGRKAQDTLRNLKGTVGSRSGTVNPLGDAEKVRLIPSC